MRKYYFDLYDGQNYTPDDDGTEIASRELARAEAVGILADMADEELPEGVVRELVVELLDETRKPILRVSLLLSATWLE